MPHGKKNTAQHGEKLEMKRPFGWPGNGVLQSFLLRRLRQGG